ncbi:MAG: ribonuclease P protein component [Candidatus Marinimicrobia bacterium]|nr:ribonuclease P protein component [Candidatus Neomarinimicrobiota bacterium]
MKQTLARALWLKHKEDFTRVFDTGTKFQHKRIAARMVDSSTARVGCAVSSRYGSSVQRNRFKRRVRAVFRQRYQQLPCIDLVITPRHGRGEIPYREIEEFFSEIIDRHQ